MCTLLSLIFIFHFLYLLLQCICHFENMLHGLPMLQINMCILMFCCFCSKMQLCLMCELKRMLIGRGKNMCLIYLAHLQMCNLGKMSLLFLQLLEVAWLGSFFYFRTWNLIIDFYDILLFVL